MKKLIDKVWPLVLVGLGLWFLASNGYVKATEISLVSGFHSEHKYRYYQADFIQYEYELNNDNEGGGVCINTHCIMTISNSFDRTSTVYTRNPELTFGRYFNRYSFHYGLTAGVATNYPDEFEMAFSKYGLIPYGFLRVATSYHITQRLSVRFNYAFQPAPLGSGNWVRTYNFQLTKIL